MFGNDLAPSLTRDELAPLLHYAADLWSAGDLSAAQERALSQVEVQVADLAGARLGQALGTTITLDINAAGHGWFVDPTPGQNEKFTLFAANDYRANRQSAIGNRKSEIGNRKSEIGNRKSEIGNLSTC